MSSSAAPPEKGAASAAPPESAASSSAPPDESPAPPSPDTPPSVIYCCRRCRQPLFRHDALAHHTPSAHAFTYRRMEKEGALKGAPPLPAPPGEPPADGCTSHFLTTPVGWMAAAAATGAPEKLTCPNPSCGVKVGDLVWAGVQCSCGTWVAPGIQIGKRGLDARPVVVG